MGFKIRKAYTALDMAKKQSTVTKQMYSILSIASNNPYI
jgi:hypothetical protein